MTYTSRRSAAREIRDLGSEGERTLETQLRYANATHYQREYRFDSARKWRFDFAWPEQQVAVEVEGGTWSDGRHSRGAGFEADCRKYDEAAVQGWLVLRVTTQMVESGEAVNLIGRALWSRRDR